MNINSIENATHIVTDPVSDREVYVNKELYDKADQNIDIYFSRHERDLNANTLTFIRERASIDELLDFANEVRVAGGGEVINELLMSEPTQPNNCLIANALNFDCEVSDNLGDWAMITDSEIVEKISSATGLNIIGWSEDYEAYEEEIGVELPKHIEYVARAFDTYVDVELEQYDILRQDNESNPVS
jgi:hypothetical protein